MLKRFFQNAIIHELSVILQFNVNFYANIIKYCIKKHELTENP